MIKQEITLSIVAALLLISTKDTLAVRGHTDDVEDYNRSVVSVKANTETNKKSHSFGTHMTTAFTPFGTFWVPSVGYEYKSVTTTSKELPSEHRLGHTPPTPPPSYSPSNKFPGEPHLVGKKRGPSESISPVSKKTPRYRRDEEKQYHDRLQKEATLIAEKKSREEYEKNQVVLAKRLSLEEENQYLYEDNINLERWELQQAIANSLTN